MPTSKPTGTPTETPAPTPTPTRAHAVVMGGGIAGLLAARVLADAYARVTIVERDLLPVTTAHRRGIPQGRHVHAILPRGLALMEELLPGLTTDLLRAGARTGDVCRNGRWYLAGRRLPQVDAGLPAVAASRPLIEAALRLRVRTLPSLSILDGHDVVGLRPEVPAAGAAMGRITGVRVTSRHGQGSQVLPADLVIDATGRASRSAQWCAGLGFPEPPADRVTIDVAYASRIFRCPPDVLGDDIAVITARFPGQRRSSVMQQLEDGTVLVTLSGILGERPPAELAAFTEYARSLPAPDTYETIRSGEPIGDPHVFRLPSYVRRRYERLTSHPYGLLVLGDAACNFNPVYAQGMAVAAIHAAALRDELSQPGEPDPGRFFATLAQTLDAPWGLSVGADLAVPGANAPTISSFPLPPSPVTAEYLGRLQLAATTDGALAAAFLRVTSLIDPPAALLHPDIVERVDRPFAPVLG